MIRYNPALHTADLSSEELMSNYGLARQGYAGAWTDTALDALDLREEDLFGLYESVDCSPDVGWEGWVSVSSLDDPLLSDEDLAVLKHGDALRFSARC